MMGKKAMDAAMVLVEETGLKGVLDPAEFLAAREAILDDLFAAAGTMPGAERLVRHLHAHGVPIAVSAGGWVVDGVVCLCAVLLGPPPFSPLPATQTHIHTHNTTINYSKQKKVATSSHRRHFDLKTQRHAGLFALFDHVVTGDQVTNGKPAPDIFAAAAAAFPAARAPAAPACCLVFEDAPVGAQAAAAAGMPCVLVPDSNLDKTLVEGCGAAAVITSLEAFVPEEWGLPPYASAQTAEAP
jgi:pseudouridine-5'-monophosphatase